VCRNIGYQRVDLRLGVGAATAGAFCEDERAKVAEQCVRALVGLRLVELGLAIAGRLLGLLRELRRLRLDLVH
jgi:hypothetical protein